MDKGRGRGRRLEEVAKLVEEAHASERRREEAIQARGEAQGKRPSKLVPKRRCEAK